MLRTDIRLSKYNDKGVLASLEEDDGLKSVWIHLSKSNSDPVAACKAAARKLRLMADGFDELASTTNPLNGDTQESLNSRLQIRSASK